MSTLSYRTIVYRIGVRIGIPQAAFLLSYQLQSIGSVAYFYYPEAHELACILSFMVKPILGGHFLRRKAEKWLSRVVKRDRYYPSAHRAAL